MVCIVLGMRAGALISETHYKNDKRDGVHRIWALMVRLKEVHYVGDKREGATRYWDKSGDLLFANEYGNDKLWVRCVRCRRVALRVEQSDVSDVSDVSGGDEVRYRLGR